MAGSQPGVLALLDNELTPVLSQKINMDPITDICWLDGFYYMCGSHNGRAAVLKISSTLEIVASLKFSDAGHRVSRIQLLAIASAEFSCWPIIVC